MRCRWKIFCGVCGCACILLAIVLLSLSLSLSTAVRSITGHKAAVSCLDFHRYGDILASGSMDTNVKVCIHTKGGLKLVCSAVRGTALMHIIIWSKNYTCVDMLHLVNILYSC